MRTGSCRRTRTHSRLRRGALRPSVHPSLRPSTDTAPEYSQTRRKRPSGRCCSPWSERTINQNAQGACEQQPRSAVDAADMNAIKVAGLIGNPTRDIGCGLRGSHQGTNKRLASLYTQHMELACAPGRGPGAPSHV
eukprot:3941899-Rhodomonas_salina.3